MIRAAMLRPGRIRSRATAAGSVLAGLPRGEIRRGSTWRIGVMELHESGRGLELRPGTHGVGPLIAPETLHGISATLTADPFLYRDASGWHVFYEVVPRGGHGAIAASSSPDLATWHHHGLVLEEPWHLSYPNVVERGGRVWLCPESSAAEMISIYEPVAFPTAWRRADVLLRGRSFADPTLFEFDGRWWLFTETSGGGHDELRLYHCDDEWRTWTEHPSSPVCTTPTYARPAGTPIVTRDGRLFRFGQDCSGEYGRRVALLEIRRLSPDSYEERFVDWMSLPVRRPWLAQRSHHVSAVRLGDDGWLAAVDGRGYESVASYAARRFSRPRRARI